jgi:hypothetical protein
MLWLSGIRIVVDIIPSTYTVEQSKMLKANCYINALLRNITLANITLATGHRNLVVFLKLQPKIIDSNNFAESEF